MRALHRGAIQRRVPKHPRRPSSHALGARTIWRQHWREAASTERAVTYVIRSASTSGPPVVGSTAVPTTVRHRVYRPTRASYHYRPRAN